MNAEVKEQVVRFYRKVRQVPAKLFSKDYSKMPHYSLRTLCRFVFPIGYKVFFLITIKIKITFCIFISYRKT